MLFLRFVLLFTDFLITLRSLHTKQHKVSSISEETLAKIYNRQQILNNQFVFILSIFIGKLSTYSSISIIFDISMTIYICQHQQES